MQLDQGIRRIALARSVQFHVGDLHRSLGDPCSGQPAHGQPVQAQSQLFRLLVGRHIGWDEQSAVQGKTADHLPQQVLVPQVDGIEGAAVHPQPHCAPPRARGSTILGSFFFLR